MKKKLEWRVGIKMAGSDVTSYAVQPNRAASRKHKNIMKNGPFVGTVWIERHETVFDAHNVKIINVSKIR